MNKKTLITMMALSGVVSTFTNSALVHAFNNNGIMGGVVPFFQLVTGFTDEVWTAMDGNMPGFLEKAGLVARLNKVRDIMVANISVGCTDIPTSGSATTTDGGTLTYGVATKSAPASFTTTGKYDKQVKYQGTFVGSDGLTYTISDLKEFYCSSTGSASYDAFALYDSAGTLQGQFETFYEKSDTITNFQAFIPPGGALGSAIAFALKINPADTTFNLWVAQSNSQNSLYGGYRVAATANYSTQKTSIYYTELQTSQSCAATSAAAFAATAWAQSTSVSDGTNTFGSGCTNGITDFVAQGCMANYDANASDLTSTTTCPGLDLVTPPVPGLDADGKLSMAWVATSLSSKVFTP